jgi:hypothetical protein
MWKYVGSLVLILAGIGFSDALEVAARAQTKTPGSLNTCVKCHADVGDELAAPIAEVQNDVHGRRGFPARSRPFAESVTAMPNS